MARVVTADGNGRGSLNIAGTTLEAELPKEIQAGQELRLTVRHVSPDRVELSMSDPSGASAQARPGGPPARRGHSAASASATAVGDGGMAALGRPIGTRWPSATTRRRSARSTCGSSSIPSRCA